MAVERVGGSAHGGVTHGHAHAPFPHAPSPLYRIPVIFFFLALLQHYISVIQHLHLTYDSVSGVRILKNANHSIPLSSSGSRLLCKLKGAAPEPLDQAFVDRRILRPGSSSGFQEHAAEAIKAIFTSAAKTFPNSWPVHCVPYWPGKEVRDVIPCTPAASDPAAEWWPKLGGRAVLKQRPSQSNRNGSRVGQAVHEDAMWYLSCCCLHRQNGCPVECLVMQTRSQPGELQVIFSGDCRHTSYRSWEDCRRADRLQHDITRRSTQMQRSGLRP